MSTRDIITYGTTALASLGWGVMRGIGIEQGTSTIHPLIDFPLSLGLPVMGAIAGGTASKLEKPRLPDNALGGVSYGFQFLLNTADLVGSAALGGLTALVGEGVGFGLGYAGSYLVRHYH